MCSVISGSRSRGLVLISISSSVGSSPSPAAGHHGSIPFSLVHPASMPVGLLPATSMIVFIAGAAIVYGTRSSCRFTELRCGKACRSPRRSWMPARAVPTYGAHRAAVIFGRRSSFSTRFSKVGDFLMSARSPRCCARASRAGPIRVAGTGPHARSLPARGRPSGIIMTMNVRPAHCGRLRALSVCSDLHQVNFLWSALSA